MKLDRFNEVIHIFLVSASQMAYIEDARKTYAMLQQFDELFRYMMKKEASVTLREEIKVLKVYMDMQSARYSGRFKITFENELMNSDISINHLCLLEFVDDIMDKALCIYEGYFCISFRLYSEKEVFITADLESNFVKESSTMRIQEV